MHNNLTKKSMILGGIIDIGLVLLGQFLIEIGNGGFPFFGGGEKSNSNTGLGLEILHDTDFHVEQNLYVNLTQVELSHCPLLLTAVNELISSGSTSFSLEVVPEESECLYTFQDTYIKDTGGVFFISRILYCSFSIYCLILIK